ncbi:DMT family transporter [Nocardioides sambongensis]|uniref:DMT family transporter n=1 Tax=Nocardioides sambongensis TaxID=2589074 RepID=UPI001125EEE1|nr:SMR family transporter [Nocardioides sambongensis]
MRRWWLLTAAIASEVTATLALKAALDLPVLYLVVAVGYVVAFGLLALTLRAGMGLGVAYGIWGAAGAAGTATLAALIWNEPLTWVMALGIALVMVGVVMVEAGSRHGPQEVL